MHLSGFDITHYDGSSESKVPDVKVLYSLCSKMEAIFQLHFLQLLEFTPQEVKLISQKSYELRRKLELK